MSLTFSCPHCHNVYKVDDGDAGKKMKCRVCGDAISVPRAVVPPPIIQPTPSGSPIIRHRAPIEPPPIVHRATPFLSQISKHIENTIGHVPMVFHEIVSTSIHVDLHVVPPTNLPPSAKHPLGTSHVTVVTSGMSSRPMNAPPGYAGPKFIELMIALPADWPGLKTDGTFDKDTMKLERNWWPFRWLKQAARLPGLLNTFLGVGHTIPNGESADAFADNTRLGCMMVVPPLLSPKSVKLIINDNVTIYFLALMPLYPEEMKFKLSNGPEALERLLDAARLTELIRIDRPSVAADV